MKIAAHARQRCGARIGPKSIERSSPIRSIEPPPHTTQHWSRVSATSPSGPIASRQAGHRIDEDVPPTFYPTRPRAQLRPRVEQR